MNWKVLWQALESVCVCVCARSFCTFHHIHCGFVEPGEPSLPVCPFFGHWDNCILLTVSLNKDRTYFSEGVFGCRVDGHVHTDTHTHHLSSWQTFTLCVLVITWPLHSTHTHIHRLSLWIWHWFLFTFETNSTHSEHNGSECLGCREESHLFILIYRHVDHGV